VVVKVLPFYDSTLTERKDAPLTVDVSKAEEKKDGKVLPILLISYHMMSHVPEIGVDR
jgi:hypothetical protein